MVKENTGVVTALVGAAVGLILMLALIGALATETQNKTTYTGVTTESHALTLTGFPKINTTAVYTVTNAPTGWKIEDCPLTSFAIKNVSGQALTLTDDYTVNLSAGTYQLKNTVNTNTTFALYGANNKTYVDYNYCADDYLNSSWGRTILNTGIGILAVAILVVAIVLVYKLLGNQE